MMHDQLLLEYVPASAYRRITCSMGIYRFGETAQVSPKRLVEDVHQGEVHRAFGLVFNIACSGHSSFLVSVGQTPTGMAD